METLSTLADGLSKAVNSQLLEKDQAKRILQEYITNSLGYNIKEDKAVAIEATPVEVSPVEIVK